MELDEPTPEPLVSWLKFQFMEITTCADMLKDTLESLKTRKLDLVLPGLETSTPNMCRYTSSIVQNCHRVIAEHVHNLLNIDSDMRKEFAKRFPSEVKKLKYAPITVPSFCNIRSENDTDISSPEKKTQKSMLIPGSPKLPTWLVKTLEALESIETETVVDSEEEKDASMNIQLENVTENSEDIEETSTDERKAKDEYNNLTINLKVGNEDMQKKGQNEETRKVNKDKIIESNTTDRSQRLAKQLRTRKIVTKESKKDSSKKTSGKGEMRKKKEDSQSLSNKLGRKPELKKKKSKSLSSCDSVEIFSDNESPSSSFIDVKGYIDKIDPNLNESMDASKSSEADVTTVDITNNVVEVFIEEAPGAKSTNDTLLKTTELKSEVRKHSIDSDDDIPMNCLTRSTKTCSSAIEAEIRKIVLERSDSESESDVTSHSESNGLKKWSDSESCSETTCSESNSLKKPVKSSKDVCNDRIPPEKNTKTLQVQSPFGDPKLCLTPKVIVDKLDSIILEELNTTKFVTLSPASKEDEKDMLSEALRRISKFNPILTTKMSKKAAPRRSAKPTVKSKSGLEIINDAAVLSDETESEMDVDKDLKPDKKKLVPKFGEYNKVNSDIDDVSDQDDLDQSNNSSDGEDMARKFVLGYSDSLKTKESNKKKYHKYKTPTVSVSASRETEESSDSEVGITRNKRLVRKKVMMKSRDTETLESDEGKAISSDQFGRTNRRTTRNKRKARQPTSSSNSEYGSKKKQRKKVRRRIRTTSTDENSGDTAEKESPKGRKNIREVMRETHLERSTQQAGQDEEERKARVAEKQKLFNECFQVPSSADKELTELVLDFDSKTKQPILSVDPKIVKKLKPHQAEGIRFMWNTCFESVAKKGPGDGCILAHCMGLGKTLQAVAFFHTVLTNKKLLGLRTALVICPLSTVVNWFNEFKMWLKDTDTRVNLHRLWESKGKKRTTALEDWKRLGGVGIIHYDAFRILVTAEDKKGKNRLPSKQLKIIQDVLINPGADIVVCDEGHLLKNPQSQLSKAVNKVGTRRRIVLTGTPLQNNLLEYHTMMQFVKPKLLGTRKEFSNRFVNPIANGQHKDSGERDVKVMKRRAHVLHKLLDGCVQRLDYSVLTPFLPPKYEYAITINLSEIQKKMYLHYMDNFSGNKKGEKFSSKNLFKDYQSLVKIWTHPMILKFKVKQEADDDVEEDVNSVDDFIVDKTTTEFETTTEDESRSERTRSDSDWSANQRKKRKAKKEKSIKYGVKDAKEDKQEDIDNAKSDKQEDIEELGEGKTQNNEACLRGWYNSFLNSLEDPKAIEHSGKLLVLMEILKTCESVGDKVLIFSQYLTSLDLIEDLLADFDEASEKTDKEGVRIPEFLNQPAIGRWRLGVDYFRIDGSTKSEDRQRSCNTFNRDTAVKAKLFLISTRAGGLGINLVGANRVVIFDASWNPSQDLQSIFRIYRFGQNKPCYVYRLLARGTMEERIYNRQVVKLSLSCRVIDEQQIERHFQFDEIQQMYYFDPDDKTERPTPIIPKDRLLAGLLISQKDWIFSYLEHDSLLENKQEEELTEEERKAAWEEYNNINQGIPNRDSMEMDKFTATAAQILANRLPGKSFHEYVRMGSQAIDEVQLMGSNCWNFIHADEVQEDMKIGYREQFDELYNSLESRFGSTNWDAHLSSYPPRTSTTNAYLYQRRIPGTFLASLNSHPVTGQNFGLTSNAPSTSVYTSMLANYMVNPDSTAASSSSRVGAASTSGLVPRSTAIPSSSCRTYPSDPIMPSIPSVQGDQIQVGSTSKSRKLNINPSPGVPSNDSQEVIILDS